MIESNKVVSVIVAIPLMNKSIDDFVTLQIRISFYCRLAELKTKKDSRSSCWEEGRENYDDRNLYLISGDLNVN